MHVKYMNHSLGLGSVYNCSQIVRLFPRSFADHHGSFKGGASEF